MEKVNLDLIPEELIELIARAPKIRGKYYRYEPMSTGVGAGFHYERMMDWRSLERRHHQLMVIRNSWSDRYWNSLKKLMDEADGRYDRVWIMEEGSDWVIEFDGQTTGTRRSLELIEVGIKNPKRKGLIVAGEHARTLLHANYMNHTFASRVNTYYRAFTRAVNLRLTEFVKNSGLYDRDHHFWHSAIFIVRNDDREHVVELENNGELKWNRACRAFAS